MSVSFSHAWGMVGIGVAAALAAMLAWAVVYMGTRRARALWLPGMAGMAIALAVAGPMVKSERRAGEVVILLDLSGSTRISPWRNPRWVRELAQRRLGVDAAVTVVGFAGTARMLMEHVGVGDEGRWPTAWETVENEDRTDAGAALAWRSAAELRGEEAAAPRWLITDGLEKMPAELGPMPLAVTEVPPSEPDMGLVNIRRLGSGEVDVQVRATGPATGRLVVRRDGEDFAQQNLMFSEGGGSTRWVTLRDAEGEGAHRYEAVIVRTPVRDPWPENDRASVRWSPPAAPRVLTVKNGAAFPVDLRALLTAGQQVVVLDGGVALAARQAATLEAFVRDTGGGLLLNEVNAPPTDGETLAALSPVFNAPPDRPAARIVFLLDASGSMNESATAGASDQKFRLASRGVIGAIELLHAEDELTVLTFNGEAQRIGAGTKKEIAATLEERLLQVQPTGPTSPDAALAAIANAFANKPADAPAMVVLLTDGEIPSMEAGRWEAMLRSSGAALTIIAPRASQRDALSALADAVHAAWYSTGDATRWPLLLRRAVSERFVGRERMTPLEWQSENLEGGELRGTTSRWREVWRKPEALDLAHAGGVTLAAIAQRGLGRVAAMAMDDSSAAGAALLDRMVQRLAPPAGDRRVTLSSNHVGDRWVLTAEAIDNGEFMNGLSLQAKIVTTDGVVDVPLAAEGPGHYEAALAASHPFEAIVTERGGGGDRFVGAMQAPQMEVGEWPASVEAGDAMKIPDGVTLLQADPSAGVWSPRVESAPFRLAPLLWALAILLLMIRLLVGRFG